MNLEFPGEIPPISCNLFLSQIDILYFYYIRDFLKCVKMLSSQTNILYMIFTTQPELPY